MHEDNPYAPPLTPSVESPSLTERFAVDPASQGKRFINFIVDRFVTYGLAYASGYAMGLAYLYSRSDPTAPVPPETLTLINVADFVQSVFVALGYYFVCEALWGRTLGKLLTGTRVVAANGGHPTLPQLLGRTFARIIPFEPFSFLDKNNPVGWHDSLSGTRVVSVR